ncbi:MAG: hypothetical protein HQK72_09335 [Desulfamplus sp.]|nr:hypothetical protein [Desulfamplus sp.]
MVITPSLRQIMYDKESLRDYSRGILPDFSAIKMRLFLSERILDTRLPDHYYLRGREFSLNGIDSLSSLLSKGLHRLSSCHLELMGNLVHVKVDAWSDWQELLTFCTPLTCISAILWKEKFSSGIRERAELADFMIYHIYPNARYSCLPAPRFPAMQGLLRDSGLYDLHVHLNGATETDIAWQFFLKKPFDVYKEFKKAFEKPKVREQIDVCKELQKVFEMSKVREQIEQEASNIIDKPIDIYRLLMTARRIRWGIVHALFYGKYTPDISDALKTFNNANFFKIDSMVDSMLPTCTIHPMSRVFQNDIDASSTFPDVALESLMYVLIIDRLDKEKEDELAASFHYYLLILGLVNRLIVQQLNQNGFDQFQKITMNSFREAPEKSYARRFFQMHGNHCSNIEFIEGRFAPKSKPIENIKLLERILKGWKTFEKKCKKNNSRVPKLQLVSHFIKSEDESALTDYPQLSIRHKKLRIENWQKAKSLLYVRDNYPKMRDFLVGVDAAANELETPPEVFAPVYRLLRKRGIRHFTYHAGEDFHHLIGGMRAIYEAVEFLGMQQGDRIGHGTAVGIEPDIWLKYVGEQLIVSEGEWLDDIIFLLHLIEKYPDSALNSKIAVIQKEIDKHSQQIYSKHYSTYSHIRAWLLRRYCPFHILYELGDAINIYTWSEDEWRELANEKIDKETRELINLYHQDDCRKRYHKKIRIESLQILSKENLRELQDILLSELYERGVVLEVLPTSNVRISFYKNHEEHHIWRWLGVQDGYSSLSKMPPVVIGTDDTGIFSTNILNEYYHIYYQLTKRCSQPHNKALEILKQLVDNSKTYAFISENIR